LERAVAFLRRTFAVFGVSGCLVAAWAAPSDVFLSARPEPLKGEATLEVGIDRMNTQLDVLGLRTTSSNTDTATSSYGAHHLSGGLKLGEQGWLTGSLRQRAIADGGGTYRYASWQVSGQYRLLEEQSWQPATALRVSAWGNYADQTESNKAVVVPGAKLDSVKIARPADRQLQADLVGTWNPYGGTEVSAALGLGTSELSYGSLSATTTMDGCNYNLSFTGNAVYGVVASPCSTGIYVKEIYDNSGRLGIDVANEIAWRGNFVQAGFNARWQHGPWTWRAGYLLFMVQRDAVDAILASRKQTSYAQNHSIGLEASYRLQGNLQLFATGLISSNLFFNDIPITYNTSTAARFGSRYSVFGTGLRFNF
jgi:hypothetical protein